MLAAAYITISQISCVGGQDDHKISMYMFLTVLTTDEQQNKYIRYAPSRARQGQESIQKDDV